MGWSCSEKIKASIICRDAAGMGNYRLEEVRTGKIVHVEVVHGWLLVSFEVEGIKRIELFPERLVDNVTIKEVAT